MAAVTGSTTIDWSLVSLAQVDFTAHFVTFLNRVDQIVTAIKNPSNYVIVSGSPTKVVLDLASGGRLTIQRSQTTYPYTGSFTFINPATGEELHYAARVPNSAQEFMISGTFGSAGFSETIKGSIFVPDEFPPTGNVSGTVTSLVVKVGSATVTFSGTLNMTGDLTSANLTGTVTGIAVVSGTNTIKMTGLALDIDVIEAAFASNTLSTVTDLFSVVGNQLNGDDLITYRNNSGVGMSFFGDAGNDTIIISGPNGDTLNGGDGNDTIDGGLGEDTVNGEAGDDQITMLVTAGNVDTIDAGEDNDTLVLSGLVPENHEVVIELFSVTDQVVSIGGVVDALTQINFEHLNAAGVIGFVQVTGSDVANTIVGSKGNDVINGALGDDTVAGGLGNDTYWVDSVNDLITEGASAGIDTVQSTAASFTLGANIENLMLMEIDAVPGGPNDLNGTGNALNNVLVGNLGINILTGGLGNDTYVVQNDEDSVVETLNAGIDLVQSAAANFTLGDHVENLTLFDIGDLNGTGNGLNNILIGNGGDNILSGLAGNDILNGNDGIDILSGDAGNDTLKGGMGDDILNGGIGADTMVGGLGDDTYVRDSAKDVIAEALDAGTDTVESSIDYRLGANLENLMLTGAALTGTGNALSNFLAGTDGDNSLFGLAGEDWLAGGDGNDFLNGGLGTDTMVGGLGDDLFVLDTIADTVTEAVGEGSDTVHVAYNVAIATEINLNSDYGGTVENIHVLRAGLFNLTGNAVDNSLTGNGSNNILIGNDGNDILDGGLGSDTMTGGTGDDTYVVDNVADQVTELNNEGIDTLRINRSVNLNLGLFDEIENVVLTGTAALNATGDEGDNTLTGNVGANILNGGAGNDTLIGHAGNDTLNGGTGQDSAQYSGPLSEYVLGSVGEMLTVTDRNLLNGNEGADQVTGIEQLHFADATLTVARGEVPVNTGTSGSHDPSAVAGLATGGYVVTWTAADVPFASGVYAQRYTAQGVPVGSTTRVNTTTVGDQHDSAVAGLATGGYVVTWTDDGKDGSFAGIYVQRYNAQGARVGGEMLVNTTTAGDQLDSAVAGLADGGYVVTWMSADASSVGIYAQRYNAQGARVGGETLVNTTTAGGQQDSAVAGLADGGYVVIWGSADASSVGIYAQRYDDQGIPVGGETLVNTTTAGDQVDGAVAGLADGGYIVTWTSSDALYSQRYDAQGVPVGGETLVNPTAAHSGAVAGLANGGHVVTWTSAVGSSSFFSSGIYAQPYDAQGEAVGGYIVTGTAGADQLTVGTHSLLTVDGAGGDDMLIGGTSHDRFFGGDGNDTLLGGGGNDTLFGGLGDDVLNGGTGNDTMTGGAGNDTYVIDVFPGDVINEAANEGTDTVQTHRSVALGLFTFQEIENVVLTGTAALNAIGNGLDNVLTGNGAANTLTGNDGNDTLIGNAGNDTLNGGAGDDAMDGGAGNDTFGFALGDGQDLVQDSSGTADRVLFQGAINPLDLIISQQANDLRIAIEGTTDQITVQNWFTSTANRTETIQAGNGDILLSTQVQQLIDAMAAFTTNTGVTWEQAAAGSGDQTQYQAILAANWQSSGA